jgi:hypothetical protein
MKAIFLICCILVFVLLGLSCAPETKLEISVTEVDNGVIIQNTGTVDCIALVTSPEGEQQFELAVGEGITFTDIMEPIEIAAVSLLLAKLGGFGEDMENNRQQYLKSTANS